MVSLIRLFVLLCFLFPPRAVVGSELKFKLHEIGHPGGGKFGQTSLVDRAEIIKRRPDDWDGKLDKFQAYKGFDVPTLIARDGVHPSNPQKYRKDYSAEGLKHNGFALRNYLALMKYAEVIRHALKDDR